ncbi:MAG: hypothetical protein ABI645_00840 [Pseudomonadota bacterium]
MSGIFLGSDAKVSSINVTSVATKDGDTLTVMAASQQRTLVGGRDFKCSGGTLTLVAPVPHYKAKLDQLTDRVDTWYTFSRAQNGGLVGATQTVEHAGFAALKLRGRRKEGPTSQWDPTGNGTEPPRQPR